MMFMLQAVLAWTALVADSGRCVTLAEKPDARVETQAHDRAGAAPALEFSLLRRQGAPPFWEYGLDVG
jgi:hypothetical protein